MAKWIKHGIFYQAIWLIAAFSQQNLLIVALLFCWFVLMPVQLKEFMVVTLLACIGISFEQLLALGNWYQFHSNISALAMLGFIPVYLALLWFAFARFYLAFMTEVKLSMRWHYLIIFFGALSSYFAATQLELFTINWLNTSLTLSFIGFWLLLPKVTLWLKEKTYALYS
jgi:hypothetical protein